MRKIALGLACAFLFAGCTMEASAPKTKPPKVDQAQIHAAKIGGRDLRLYTFTARIDEKGNDIKAIRVLYKTGSGAYTTGADGTVLAEPLSRDGEYRAPQHNISYVTNAEDDGELESYLVVEDAELAYRFEIDYTAPESEEVQTLQSDVYSDTLKNIDRRNLSKEVKG
jgi:hypothetical protein